MSQQDDSVFDSHPVDASSTDTSSEDTVTNKSIDKLKILHEHKTAVRTLSKTEKKALMSKCIVLIEDKLKEINDLLYQKTKLIQENTTLKETL